MATPVRALEHAITRLADTGWSWMRRLNDMAPEAKPFHPKWSDQPIPRGKQRTGPPLGWPRETDSLCPVCVKEARAQILRGDTALSSLLTDKPGEIRAKIVEKDGRIVMQKTCPQHGLFEDV